MTTASYTNNTLIPQVVYDPGNLFADPVQVDPGESKTWNFVVTPPSGGGGSGVIVQPHVAAASGGNVQDAEVRAVLSTLLSELQNAGVLAAS